MLDLLDFRRQVTEQYRTIRERGDDPATCYAFRIWRDALFGTHSQSALDEAQKAAFKGLSYYPYDPLFRVTAAIDLDVEQRIFAVATPNDGVVRWERFGRVSFELPTGSGALSLFWIMGYGGGLFVPFGDATNGAETYGGGRYLYDTIKGVDLGAARDTLILDFNYAYNPSCAYNAAWVCPLSPPENKLSFLIPAGEKRPE